MFDLLPQIIIIVCLIAIVIIVARKIGKTSEIDESKVEKKQIEFFRLMKRGFTYVWSMINKLYRRLFRRMKSKVNEVKEKTKIVKDDNDVEVLDQLAEGKPMAAEVASQATVDEIIDMIEKASGFYGQGDFDNAEQMYIKIISKDPKNIRAYKGLGRIYVRQRNFKDARESFKQVLELDPKEKEAKKALKKLENKIGE